MIKGILRGSRDITDTILKVLTTLFYRGGPIASRGAGRGVSVPVFPWKPQSTYDLPGEVGTSNPITCMYYLMVSQHLNVTPSSSASPPTEMAMRSVCHSINPSLSFETAFKWLLYFQSVYNNPLSLSAERWQAF